MPSVSNITSISSLLTWTQYFWANAIKPEIEDNTENLYQVRPDLNDKVSLWKGDITTLEVDAIVNAANTSLLGGGGLDGAIHAAAGPQLLEECKTLGGCPVGEAKITGGYNLTAKHVIHAVGTCIQDPFELAKTYASCFTLTLSHSIRTIAFPCISTGIYGFDPVNAAHTALRITRQTLTDNASEIDRVIFCVYQEQDLKIYEELLQRYFPVQSPEN